MVQRLKHGKGGCVTGAVKGPNGDTKVTVDATRPTTALNAHVTLGNLQPPKVTVLGLRVLQLPQPHEQRPPRAFLPLRPRPCVMGLLIRQIVTQTSDNQVRLGYNLLQTHDSPKTVLLHP